MKTEHMDVQSDNFARIWIDAHLRRSEDFSAWIKQLLGRRRQADRATSVSPPSGRILTTG